MAAMWVEMKSPEHGLERIKIKVIRKYNVNKELIEPKYREKPWHGLAGVIVGKSVGHEEVRQYLVDYFTESGMIDNVLSMRLKV
jgi:hypothetical protein